MRRLVGSAIGIACSVHPRVDVMDQPSGCPLPQSMRKWTPLHRKSGVLGVASCLKTSTERTRDGEQPIVRPVCAGLHSARGQLHTRWMVAFASVCVVWDLNIQRQLSRCTISQDVMFMFSQRNFVIFYSSGVIDTFIKVRFSPRILFI